MQGRTQDRFRVTPPHNLNPQEMPTLGHVEALRRARGYIASRDAGRSIGREERDGKVVFKVPSHSKPGVLYSVFEDGTEWQCVPCPDYLKRHEACQHIVEVVDREFPHLAPAPPAADVMLRFINGPKKYQNARAFPHVPYVYEDGPAESTRQDHALCNEPERVEELLVDLAQALNDRLGIPKVHYRPSLPPGEKVLAMVIRAQHESSMRKAQCLLKRLEAEGKLTDAPCKGTLIAYAKAEETTTVLEEAFAIATNVFKYLDVDVITDATGFSSYVVANWLDSNYGESDFRPGTEWFKLHLIIGRFSKAILGFYITPNRGEGTADSSAFRPLYRALISRGFNPRFVIGDNAYLIPENDALVSLFGGFLVGPLKPRNFTKKTKEPIGESARRIVAFKAAMPDVHDELCRARQAIEGIISSEKRMGNNFVAVGSAVERKQRDANMQALMDALKRKQDGEAVSDEEIQALDEAVAWSVIFRSRYNDMLVRMIRQVLRRTNMVEQKWNQRISYTRGTVFSPIRETVAEPGLGSVPVEATS